MRERTDIKRARASNTERRIKMPDGTVRHAATDPKEIAAELRAKSKLGKREARLKKAEAGIGRRD